jgi:hypothetical protein
MSENNKEPTSETVQTETFVEGLDFYFEDGLMVLTRRYLLNRGYCCGSGCRHCPFTGEERVAAQSKNSSSSL